MTAWITVAAIVLFIGFILTVPIGIVIRWRDGFFLSVKVLFVKVRLLPKKEKKLRLRDYSKKNFEKMLRKKEREKERRKAKKAKKRKKKELAKGKRGTGEGLRSLSAASRSDKRDFLKVLYEMRLAVVDIVRIFGGHVHTKVAKVDVRVGASDAAKCAVLYGAISQGVAYVLEFLDRSTKMKAKRDAISVYADFEGSAVEADVEFQFSTRLIHAITAAFSFAVKYYDHNENKKTGEKK